MVFQTEQTQQAYNAILAHGRRSVPTFREVQQDVRRGLAVEAGTFPF